MAVMGVAGLACSAQVGTGGSAAGYLLPDAATLWPDSVSKIPNNCEQGCPSRPGTSATCSAGGCSYACLEGLGDCNGVEADGCEVDFAKHPKHCGSCEFACPTLDNATSLCKDKACSSVCDAGWADCLLGLDGCETQTDTNIAHCGDCTTVCESGPHSKPMCAAGFCKLDCDGGWADCNGVASDGCEIDTTSDPDHCGTCGIQCKDVKCIKSACECASTSHTATLMPLDMYIMMDQSSSMNEATGGGPSKWVAVSQALGVFVQSAEAAGIGVGIQYFAIKVKKGTTTTDSCVAADYALPEIGIAPLPANAKAIVDSVAKHKPTGSTPTYPALAGAIQYAKSFAAANPTHTVVVVLATDGVPTECPPKDVTSIAGLAATAASAAPKVLTFVVGVGKSLNLDEIAKSGGTKAAFKVDEGGNVVQQFGAALKAIQGQALGCSYAIPQPAQGQPVDPKKVNVQLTPGGGAPKLLAYKDSAAECTAGEQGWYYDDPNAPTKIQLCPDTCTSVSGDAQAKVDILLGCARASGDP